MKVASANNVKVYTVSGEAVRPLPDWLVRKKKRALRDDPDFRNRVELIQDFEFPEASNRIKVSKDGKYAVATGTYKPHIRVFDFAEMSMKFERHTTAENVQFLLLSDDWTKSVHLQADRSIEFHNQGGVLFNVRIPKFGRDLAYHYSSCDLYVAAAGDEVFRLNLEQGRFLNSLEIESSDGGVNCIDICPAHQLVGLGTEGGTLEFWDPRVRTRVGVVDVFSTEEGANAVTTLSYRLDGLNLAVGTHSGQTLLYDLRSPRPYLSKDQGYGLPMKSLHWLESRDGSEAAKILSADNKIIKVWSSTDGNPFTAVEPPLDVNDVCPVPGTGLIFAANEGIPMHTYYIPQLGPAPKWCSFLDNLTEEMEENPAQTTYDNYKFVTRKDLAALGLNKLIGTNVVKSYMHGYFIDVRLYEQAKLIANPFAYEEYRERKILEKIEKERESRIRTSAAQQVKVNKNFAARLEEREQQAAKKGKKDDNVKFSTVLQDERFKEAFANPEFEIDENTVEYAQLNPTKSTRPMFESDEEGDGFSDKEDESSSTSFIDDEERQPKRQHQRSPPHKSPNEPEMKVLSSIQNSTIVRDDSFESLLERQKNRPQTDVLRPEARPTGEMQMRWKIKNDNKKKTERSASNVGYRSSTRRSASKNVLRKIRK